MQQTCTYKAALRSSLAFDWVEGLCRRGPSSALNPCGGRRQRPDCGDDRTAVPAPLSDPIRRWTDFAGAARITRRRQSA